MVTSTSQWVMVVMVITSLGLRMWIEKHPTSRHRRRHHHRPVPSDYAV
jgi:hypothetical protein